MDEMEKKDLLQDGDLLDGSENDETAEDQAVYGLLIGVDHGSATKKRKRKSSRRSDDGKGKKKRRWWVILLIVLGALLLLGLLALQSAWWWLHHTIDKNVQQAPEYSQQDVAAKEEEAIIQDIVQNIEQAKPDPLPKEEIDKIEQAVSNVQNIALFGVDQKSGSRGRSDTMIILSINRDSGKVKMTSLARDSLVPIEGHGEEKLTHSWAYGHAKLALKTINQAYGMNITDYVYVNFEQFIDVIDYIGGVQVHVNQLELEAINATPYENTKLPGTGTHRLTGTQALRYVRCRTDSDTNRNARQREVLIAMYEQVRRQPISKLPDTLKKVLKLCHTTLSADEIMDVAKWAILNPPTIESLRLPNAQLKPWSGILDKARGWVYVYDLDAAKKVLYNFIYEVDVQVTGVTEYVPEPSEETQATNP